MLAEAKELPARASGNTGCIPDIDSLGPVCEYDLWGTATIPGPFRGDTCPRLVGICFKSEDDAIANYDVHIVCTDMGSAFHCEGFPRGGGVTHAWTVSGNVSLVSGTQDDYLDLTCDSTGSATVELVVTSPFNVSTNQTTMVNCSSASQASGQVTTGTWDNPNRPGPKLSITRTADGSLVAGWLTFREDGTPIWYVTSTGQVSNGVWQADLIKTYRYNYGGINRTVVGNVQLQFINDDVAVFSWNFDNVGSGSGFDGVEYLAHTFGGDALTGSWFDPNEDGWGITHDRDGSQSAVTVTYYRADGHPVWARSQPDVENPGNGFYPMEWQLGIGLCPTCPDDNVALISNPAGTLNLGLMPTMGSTRPNLVAHDGSQWVRGESWQYVRVERITYE
jgi:hypothetical protein